LPAAALRSAAWPIIVHKARIYAQSVSALALRKGVSMFLDLVNLQLHLVFKHDKFPFQALGCGTQEVCLEKVLLQHAIVLVVSPAFIFVLAVCLANMALLVLVAHVHP